MRYLHIDWCLRVVQVCQELLGCELGVTGRSVGRRVQAQHSRYLAYLKSSSQSIVAKARWTAGSELVYKAAILDRRQRSK